MVNGRAPVTSEALRLAHAIGIWYIGRRPVSERSIPAVGVRVVATAACAEGGLPLLGSDDVADLGFASSRAAAVEAGDPQIAGALTYWTGRARLSGAGLTASVLPQAPHAAPHCPAATLAGPGYCRSAAGTTGPRSMHCCWATRTATDRRAGCVPEMRYPRPWLAAPAIGVSVVPLDVSSRSPPAGTPMGHLLAGSPAARDRRSGTARAATATPRIAVTQMIDTSAVAANQLGSHAHRESSRIDTRSSSGTSKPMSICAIRCRSCRPSRPGCAVCDHQIRLRSSAPNSGAGPRSARPPIGYHCLTVKSQEQAITVRSTLPEPGTVRLCPSPLSALSVGACEANTVGGAQT